MLKHPILHLAYLLCATAALVPAVGCSENKGTGGGGAIKIASSLPRTGSARPQTDTIVNGIKMALDEVEWKLAGFKVEHLDLDDATPAAGSWTAEQEAANANRAAQDPDVMAWIGPYNSGAAKISMPILNRVSLLMISPANTWPGLTKPGLGEPGEPEMYRPTGKKNYVRVVPTDDLQGPLGAKWAQEMDVKKVYILDDNELYGAGIAKLFEQRCKELKIEVLGHESIDPKAQEFASTMIRIKGLQPDLLYFGGTTQTKGGQIVRDMLSVGLKCKLMVPDGCMEDAFIQSAGADNFKQVPCYLTFGGLPPEAMKDGPGKEFVERYQKKYNALPEAYTIYGYESARVAIAAIQKAGKKDRAAVVEAAFSLPPFNDALGQWSIDENGDTTLRTMSGNTIRAGQFQFVKLLSN